MYVYHERQLGQLCGLHCVNNLLQWPQFGPGDLAEIGVRLDRKEHRLLGSKSNGTSSENFDDSADGGNFSIQVLKVALARAGLNLLPSNHPDGDAFLKDAANAAGAFLVQRKDHWYAFRAIGPCWWNLDSVLETPMPLSEPQLKARLDKLLGGNHSRRGQPNVFFVKGRKLPEPWRTQASGDGCSEESNLHRISYLLPESVPGIDESIPAQEEQCGITAGENLENFKDAEVHAGLALTSGNRPLAADILTKAHKDIAPSLRANPKRVARALCDAVEAVLEANLKLPNSIVRIVALLSTVDSDKLIAVAALVDCTDLAHRLLTALTKKAKGYLWTEGLEQAATVAVELLLALPVKEAISDRTDLSADGPCISKLQDEALSRETFLEIGSAEKDSTFDEADYDLGGVEELEGRSLGRPSASDPGLKGMLSIESTLIRGNVGTHSKKTRRQAKLLN